jgi:heme/copper-type cytochrome/quinol oxidase subunit 1
MLTFIWALIPSDLGYGYPGVYILILPAFGASALAMAHLITHACFDAYAGWNMIASFGFLEV